MLQVNCYQCNARIKHKITFPLALISISLLADLIISGGAEAFRPESEAFRPESEAFRPESDRSLFLALGLFGDGEGLRPESDRSRDLWTAVPFWEGEDCIPGSLSLLREGELLITESLTEPRGRSG